MDSESESKKREMVSRHHQLISVCSRTWKAARLSSEVVSLSHVSRLSPQSMAQRVGHSTDALHYMNYFSSMFEFRDKLSEAYILFLTFNLTAATSF